MAHYSWDLLMGYSELAHHFQGPVAGILAEGVVSFAVW